MGEPACPGCAALRKELDELRAQVADLTRKLNEALRAGKRQAAPFRKGPPKFQPKPPGRKPGATRTTRLEPITSSKPAASGGVVSVSDGIT